MQGPADLVSPSVLLDDKDAVVSERQRDRSCRHYLMQLACISVAGYCSCHGRGVGCGPSSSNSRVT